MEISPTENIDINKNSVFIHFNNKDECTDFIKKNTPIATFGHNCCSGLGVHIKSFKGIPITNYSQIKEIKNN